MTNSYHSRIFAAALVLLSLSSSPSVGQDMMELQVSTGVSQSEPIGLSLEALDALDQIEFTTSTIWTDGDIHFSGVSLKALLAHLGAEGSSVDMIALNDYAVTMELSELEDEAPIVATRMNGETMPVRDKGPYWVVFPYDSDLKYRTETNYSRSIWQLNRLKVID